MANKGYTLIGTYSSRQGAVKRTKRFMSGTKWKIVEAKRKKVVGRGGRSYLRYKEYSGGTLVTVYRLWAK